MSILQKFFLIPTTKGSRLSRGYPNLLNSGRRVQLGNVSETQAMLCSPIALHRDSSGCNFSLSFNSFSCDMLLFSGLFCLVCDNHFTAILVDTNIIHKDFDFVNITESLGHLLKGNTFGLW